MDESTTVLVAESNREHSKQLAGAISRRGWQSILASDAVGATAAALRSRPDAVILSGQLPGGGGAVIVKRLRASVHTTMTPIIALVGRHQEDAENLRAQGVDECVPTPPDVDGIVDWIEKRLARPGQVLEAPSSIIRDADRLASLARTELLDTPPSDSFDTLTAMAAAILGVPVALVSLVDLDRQFFKSHVGLPEPWSTTRETPLSHSFCQWVVADHEALVVDDAREHPVLRDNRALHELGVIAYAGVPLTDTSGQPIGSFCAIDTKPRAWSEADLALLRHLTRVAEACIAIGESEAAAGADAHGSEGESIRRSAIMRAAGEGISSASEIMSTGDPGLANAQRKAMLKLLEWLGRHLVRLAGT